MEEHFFQKKFEEQKRKNDQIELEIEKDSKIDSNTVKILAIGKIYNFFY